MKKTFIIIITLSFFSIFNAQNTTEKYLNVEQFSKVDKYIDGSLMTDAKVDGYIYIKENQNYYKKVLERPYNLLDFGAIGDGIANDFPAVIKAIDFISKTKNKILIIPDNYIFNINGQTLNLPDIVIDFQGGILTNGFINGNKTKIDARRIKILDKIKLSGVFIPLSGYAYPEWFGGFPNDKSIDVVDALKSLDPVFSDIELGIGEYFTKTGEYQVKGLKGVSMASSKILLETDKSNTFALSMGKIGGIYKDRNYDYNYIKDITILFSSKNAKRLKGNRGIIIGAVHKPLIENVKIYQYNDYQTFSKQDLETFYNNNQKVNEANIGVEFNGDSEVSTIKNLFTLGDIGIMFSKSTDFSTISDFMSWNAKYGIASVYYKSDATESSNILFTGSQSWNQGLYGLYTETSASHNSFTNTKFENIRIEQLETNLIKNNELKGANIWINSGNENISNLQFSNIMLSGTSNGIYIGPTTYGKITFENITTWSDAKVKKAFALNTTHKNQYAPLIIYLKNVSLYPDTKSIFNNANLLYNGRFQEEAFEGANLFMDNTIIAKTNILKSVEMSNYKQTHIQQVKIPNNNTNHIPLVNSNLSTIKNSFLSVKFEIELYTNNQYEKIEFVISKNGQLKILNSFNNLSLFSISNLIKEQKFNLLQDKDSGLIFLFNKLGEECFLDIKTTVIQ